MANQDYLQVLSLKNEGCSLQQIADELGLSKAKVHRLLKGEGQIVSNVPETFQERSETLVSETFQTFKNRSKTPENGTNQHHMTESQIQLERLKIELEHKCKMEELAIQRLGLEYKRKEHLLKEAQTLKAAPEKSQLFIETRSEKLMKRYHKLVNSFHEQVENEDWPVEDCETYISEVEKLIEDVEKFASKSLELEHEDLVIWNNLKFLQSLVTSALETHNSSYFKSSCVSIELDEDEQEWVDTLSDLSSIDEIVEEDED